MYSRHLLSLTLEGSKNVLEKTGVEIDCGKLLLTASNGIKILFEIVIRSRELVLESVQESNVQAGHFMIISYFVNNL